MSVFKYTNENKNITQEMGVLTLYRTPHMGCIYGFFIVTVRVCAMRNARMFTSDARMRRKEGYIIKASYCAL